MVKRRLELNLGGKQFIFNMTNHMRNFNDGCRAIAEWIMDQSGSESGDVRVNDWRLWFPFRYSYIPPGHTLFRWLDEESQKGAGRDRNWLIFEGHPFDHSSLIRVTHFGPFGLNNSFDLGDKWHTVQSEIEKRLGDFGIDPDIFVKSPEDLKDAEHRFIMSLRGHFLALRPVMLKDSPDDMEAIDAKFEVVMSYFEVDDFDFESDFEKFVDSFHGLFIEPDFAQDYLDMQVATIEC